MFESVTQVLAANPILTMFVVIGVGYIVGELNFFGFRFGVVGVLFVGLAAGALSADISVPELVPTLGLILFIYTIGIQSGPAFFQSFRKHGWRDSLFVAALLIAGAALTMAVSRPLHLEGPRRAGLFAGALTNTPALAATREHIRDSGKAQGWTAETIRVLSDEPTVAYSIAYPIGVIGVLLCFQFTRRLWKPVYQGEVAGPAIRVRDFMVLNPAVIGRSIGDVLQRHGKDPGFIVSRVQHGTSTDIARTDLQLAAGDIVAIVGEDEALERAEQIFGAVIDQHIELDRSELDFRRVFVSAAEVVGKTMRDLQLENTLGATITRLRRGDIDIVPTADTRLEYGDRVRVLTKRGNFEQVTKFFGDSIRGTAETDFGSVALGLVLGVLVGMVPIPLPGTHPIRLGMAGGPLLVALILGRLERTGRITWNMPLSANITLRQIGLLFFLSGVGVRAGWAFRQTLLSNGWEMLLGGAVVTLSVTLLTMFIGYKLLNMPFDSLVGLASGLQTQPACLAYATRMVNSEVPNVAYAAVYPAAMIVKIVLAQLLSG
jgi:putative transport protein